MCCLVSSAAAERVLVPVAYTGPGAYGAAWFTDVSVLNRSSVPLRIPDIYFAVACSIPEGCLASELAPGQAADVLQTEFRFNAPTGYLLHIPDIAAGQTEVWARIGTSLQWPSRGTELPVPHENEFRSQPRYFPFTTIASWTEVRSLLRIYAIDVTEPLTIRVQLRSRWTSPVRPIAEKVILMPPGGNGDDVLPSYTQLSLQEAFDSSGTTYGDIEIVPEIPAGSHAKIWGFITHTHNVTNEVTIITGK